MRRKPSPEPQYRIIQISVGAHTVKVSLDDEGTGIIEADFKDVDHGDRESDLYNSAINGLESLVLAQACAGIDITSKEYIQALETAVESIANNI